MTGRGPLVEVERATCRYRDEAVLVGVDLRLGDGDLVGIVGPSGSGKTSLLRAITGNLAVVSGSVRRRPGMRIGYVPQVERVDWSFPVTVAECVVMGRTRGRRLPWPSAAERLDVSSVLERLGLGGLERRHIGELSGGQQQRVFVARALLGRPDLLLLDEPTSGVDVKTRHDVLHLLVELHAEGLAIVLTTHDLNGIAAHLPSLVCLNRRVIASGPPEEVLTAAVLEETYGAPMDVLEHGGMPVVIDGWQPAGRRSRAVNLRQVGT